MRFRTLPRKPLLAAAVARACATALIVAGSAGAVTKTAQRVGRARLHDLAEVQGQEGEDADARHLPVQGQGQVRHPQLPPPRPGREQRASPSVDFTGHEVPSAFRLRKGTYRYVCDPHSDDMKGSFKVG